MLHILPVPLTPAHDPMFPDHVDPRDMDHADLPVPPRKPVTDKSLECVCQYVPRTGQFSQKVPLIFSLFRMYGDSSLSTMLILKWGTDAQVVQEHSIRGFMNKKFFK